MEEKLIEELPVKMTDEEKLLKGEYIAQVHHELVELEAEKKALMGSRKRAIDAKKDLLAHLAHELATGEELRPVQCRERPRYYDLMVDVVRMDTGRIVRSRPMEPHERQLGMDELGKGADAMPRRDEGEDGDGELH
jgi:hypothetical protein